MGRLLEAQQHWEKQSPGSAQAPSGRQPSDSPAPPLTAEHSNAAAWKLSWALVMQRSPGYLKPVTYSSRKASPGPQSKCAISHYSLSCLSRDRSLGQC